LCPQVPGHFRVAVAAVPTAPDGGPAQRRARGPSGLGRGAGPVLLAAGRHGPAGGRVSAPAERDGGRGLRGGHGHRRVPAPVPQRALELQHPQRREQPLRINSRER